MDWKLEAIVVPVSNVDRAKAFYADEMGFALDVDHQTDTFRVVQLTPPGSGCSIVLMQNDSPGSLQGLHLVVPDIATARAELESRGVVLSEPYHFVDGAQRPGPHPDGVDYGTYLSIDDPDGNGWLVQEVPSRAT